MSPVKQPATTLIYDGSFNGFLTAVFEAFDQKIHVVDIQRNGQAQSGLFSVSQTGFTQVDKAKRVWNGIRNKNHNALANVYFAFLSGAKGVEPLLYAYIQRLMRAQKGEYVDPVENTVAYLEQLARKVGREKYRMEAQTLLQESKDHIHYALIGPDHDVLPLISKHFRTRYPDQSWLIYDLKRQYGIFYDLDHVEMVSLAANGHSAVKAVPAPDTARPEDPYGKTSMSELFQTSGIRSLIKPKLYPRTLQSSGGNYGGQVQAAV